jgi:membrane protein DedA with SNARE-associated domain
MKANPSARSRLMSMISSAASWAAALLIAGWIGGVWFVIADNSAWKAVPLATVLALTAVVGITWQQARAGARRRLQAALAAYAEREIRHHRHKTASQEG